MRIRLAPRRRTSAGRYAVHRVHGQGRFSSRCRRTITVQLFRATRPSGYSLYCRLLTVDSAAFDSCRYDSLRLDPNAPDRRIGSNQHVGGSRCGRRGFSGGVWRSPSGRTRMKPKRSYAVTMCSSPCRYVQKKPLAESPGRPGCHLPDTQAPVAAGASFVSPCRRSAVNWRALPRSRVDP